jgi:hypothetical protein
VTGAWRGFDHPPRPSAEVIKKSRTIPLFAHSTVLARHVAGRPLHIHVTCSVLESGPSLWSTGSIPGANRPGCEVDRSPLSSAEGKFKRGCTSVCPIYLHGVDIGGFTYTLFGFGHNVVQAY